MRVLLTGGAGYIGAHTAVALHGSGHEVAIVDDLSAVNEIAIDRIRQLIGIDIPFVKADIRDETAVLEFIKELPPFDAVVHLAGLKSVADSVADPTRYYDVNVGGAVSLLRICASTGIDSIVFSSSATVYPESSAMPVTESAAAGLAQASPYGKTKRVVEEILRDACAAHPGTRVVSLRYFNPVGAHESGLIGEDPLIEPQNLMPVVARVAAGIRPLVRVFGDDYSTPDGTAQRDYIHVLDLAEGHVAALERAPRGSSVFNLGTGRAVSVLELIRAFQHASGRTINYEVTDRREGDLGVSYADPSLARDVLGWVASRTIEDACSDYWRWQVANPRGYRS